MTAQPHLQAIPSIGLAPRKGQPGYVSPVRGRTFPKAPCGVCGHDAMVKENGEFRAHGPWDDRCDGTNTLVRAHVEKPGDVFVGTCGLCGLIEDGVPSPKTFLRQHNHGRPQVTIDHRLGLVFVTWFRYRTGQWRRRAFLTHQEAMDFAQNLRERSA